MPDGDVYSRQVPKGWQTAARFVFTGQDDAVTIPKLIRALGQFVKDGGCPGINDIATIAADALISPHAADLQEVKRDLAEINRYYASDRTALASDVARRIVASPVNLFPDASVACDNETIRISVVRKVLVELLMNQMSSTALQTSLINSGDVTFHEYWHRQRHVNDLLSDSPEVEVLARQLLHAPEGKGIKTPRVHISRLTPEEFVSFPLTGE